MLCGVICFFVKGGFTDAEILPLSITLPNDDFQKLHLQITEFSKFFLDILTVYIIHPMSGNVSFPDLS